MSDKELNGKSSQKKMLVLFGILKKKKQKKNIMLAIQIKLNPSQQGKPQIKERKK